MAVRTRNNWSWGEDVIWVLNIRAVGSYFSSVTGWPPMSVGVWLGTYYTFFPTQLNIKQDHKNRLLPREHYCQLRSELFCTIDQLNHKAQLNQPEKARKDIWWIEPDGSNVEEVVQNIKTVYLDDGIQWFSQMSDLHQAFQKIEQERDCWNKYHRATYFAKRLGDRPKFEHYYSLWKKEAQNKNLPFEFDLTMR